MEKLILIITLCVFSGCSTDKSNFLFQCHPNDIKLDVSVKSMNATEVNLILKFTSTSLKKLSLDYKAFSTECFYSNDKKHLDEFINSNSRNINALINSFQYNQVIAENENGDLALLSVERNIPIEKDFKEVNCISDWVKNESFDTNGQIYFDVKIDKDNLKVLNSDKRIYIYYCFTNKFNPNDNIVIVRSNWIDI